MRKVVVDHMFAKLPEPIKRTDGAFGALPFIHLLLLATALRSDVVLETFSAETSQYLMLCHAVQVRFRRPHNEEANEAFQLYGSEGP